jgi:hypothetical protein
MEIQPMQPNAPAPAPTSTPSAAPDITPAPPADLMTGLSSLAGAPVTQPNNAEAIMGSQEGQGYQSAVAAQQAAVKRAADLANQPIIPQSTPHSRLLNIIGAIGVGLSAAGDSIATRGEKGGAAEVAQIRGEQQQQKLQAQSAAQNQRNQQIQQQLTIAGTNQTLAQSYLNLLSVPDEIEARHLQVQQGQQNLTTGAQAQQITEADFRATHGGMAAPEFNSALSDTAPVSQSPNSFFVTSAQQQLQAGTKSLGSGDPYVQQLQATLSNPKATAKDLWTAQNNLKNQVGAQVGAAKAQSDIQTAVTAGLPKTEQEAASQLAAAKTSGDTNRIAAAQSAYDTIHKSVQDERTFAANLQKQNQDATKDLAFAQKGTEDITKLWTDPQHGFSQTAAQVNATKDIVAKAKDGNELAASLEPAMAVLGVNSFAGVHRISPTEYQAAGPEVGSLYRQLNAALDKAGSGKVPADTLNEVNGIMDSLLQAKYQSSLASTRQIVANNNIPANRISVPDPNNFGGLITLDKIPATGTPGAQGPDPFAQFGGKRHQ